MKTKFKGFRLAFVPALFALGSAAACGPSATEADLEMVDEIEAEIRGGTLVATGVYEAIGIVNVGCTGTLITPSTVLTAAHCVCTGPGTTPIGSTPGYSCQTRASFTFKGVFPKDNPATSVNESLTRRDVSVDGNVIVHPDFTRGQWLANDYALIKLDRRIEELTLAVKPIQVERLGPLPAPGNSATIVGFGGTDDGGGEDCNMLASGPSAPRP